MIEVRRVIESLEHPIVVKNKYDADFLTLMEYIWKTSSEQLVENLKRKYEMLKKDFPDEEDFNTFELRARVLKQRSFEFLWLYKRLEDYQSKRTLYVILANWALLDAD